MDEHLTKFDGFVGKLKKEISVASDGEEPEARQKEDLIQKKSFGGRMEEEMKIGEMKEKGFEMK